MAHIFSIYFINGGTCISNLYTCVEILLALHTGNVWMQQKKTEKLFHVVYFLTITQCSQFSIFKKAMNNQG